jgi:diguanylate cyclase (GGDEF)-like protein
MRHEQAGLLGLGLVLLSAVLVPALARSAGRVGTRIAAVEHKALHDELTGLPNRELFRRRVEEALEASPTGEGVAVLLADLDRFKEINDSLGHESGDLLLEELGSRMRRSLVGHTFARLGGDEFAALLEGATPDEAGRVAATIVAEARRPFVVGHVTVDVGASVGIALAPEHGADVDALVRHADAAMYVAKESGSGYSFYAASPDRHGAGRLVLASELWTGLVSGGVTVEYRPRASAAGELDAFEAVACWPGAPHAPVGPEGLEALASRAGLEELLAGHVLEEALGALAAWRAARVDARLAIGLATLDATAPDRLGQLVERAGVPAASLDLHVPDRLLARDPLRAADVLGRLAASGARLVLDGFGAGATSIVEVDRLALSAVRIDADLVRQLAAGPGRGGAARAAIRVARELGLLVVADGIDTGPLRDAARALEVDALQGAAIGAPASLESVLSALGPDIEPEAVSTAA